MDPIKVVHLSTSKGGGAGIAALRLHKAMMGKDGISSSFVSLSPHEEPNTFQFTNPALKSIGKRAYNKAWRIINKMMAIQERYKVGSEYEKLIHELDCEIASHPYGYIALKDNPIIQGADIINLHWVAGLIDYPTFFSSINKPIVWTLHDMNPFRGLFHYNNDQIINHTKAGGLDNTVCRIKSNGIRSLKKKLHIVGPSNWIAEAASESDIFRKKDISTIPNSVCVNTFKYRENDIKSQLSINPDNRTLLFIAQHINNKRKGFKILCEALGTLGEIPLTLIAIGKKNEIDLPNLDIKWIGEVNDPNELAQYYSCSDGFLLPSLEDNLPNVMLEAFSCGTPVLGFPVGGIKEHVNSDTGILARDTSAEALRDAIIKFCDSDTKFSKEVIRNYAVEKFNERQQVESYLSIYRSIL